MVVSIDSDEATNYNNHNGRATNLLRSIQRAALNNVTNTALSQEMNLNNSNISNNNNALTSFKEALPGGRRDASKIPQLKKRTYPEPADIHVLERTASTYTSNSIKSSPNSQSVTDSRNSNNYQNFEDKENIDPYYSASCTITASSDALSSIKEENEIENNKELMDETNFQPTQEDIFTRENETVAGQNINSNYNIITEEDDINKKRPISQIAEYNIPKKFKVCNENGEEEYVWEDLDAEDYNDPFMVNEYVNDIFDYLYHLEVITLPKKEDFYQHKNIHQNRDILVNWLVKIHNKFGLLPESLFLAINLMDRFLCKELVQLDKLQLVGTSCLFIASKYEEVYSPSIKNFASETDGACTEEEIKEGEKFILKTLSFNLNYPNPMNFLRRISKAADYDIQSRTLAKFLLEISIVDFRFIGILPSLCSAAAMFLARKMLGKGEWDGNLIHYSGGYVKSQIAPVCKMMMDYLVSPIVHDEFHRKYQSRRFMKASIISVQWALKVRKNGYDVMTLHE
ncbi:hypothetical protein TPHA_0D04040 [Tetrapisispora phaffii CBS 4417]|uniref:Uncharacterized protein n=1 Tax=Tetrapisispora phaffii (strain ATCC 24235 / CBS 4417 / NBRC 1672 / NRRL Y-8282 / UCD 70-5) TaxID=1071381 RepID=G8BT66_TETPH|nr:hypothetical protein TPHA_0D04040 [Tetrapisispora phaffii CBS 4417]CCE63037.1 hypothetical protein TPHA_0D04040 [Tetrapisispora phaffii CBS 4417]